VACPAASDASMGLVRPFDPQDRRRGGIKQSEDLRQRERITCRIQTKQQAFQSPCDGSGNATAPAAGEATEQGCPGRWKAIVQPTGELIVPRLEPVVANRHGGDSGGNRMDEWMVHENDLKGDMRMPPRLQRRDG